MLHPVCLAHLKFFIPIFCQGFEDFNNDPDPHCDDKWLSKRFQRGDLKIRTNSSHLLKDSIIIDFAFAFNEDLFREKCEIPNSCEFDAQLCLC